MAGIANSELEIADRWIAADPGQFSANFDRKSFEVPHKLQAHPLLQLPQLMELAERTLKTRPKDLHYDAGEVRVDQRWDEIPKTRFSAKEALERVENCGAWFVFSSAQRDPDQQRGHCEFQKSTNHAGFYEKSGSPCKLFRGDPIDGRNLVLRHLPSDRARILPHLFR